MKNGLTGLIVLQTQTMHYYFREILQITVPDNLHQVWSQEWVPFIKIPGDSKWPFYPLVGGHLTFEGVT